MKFPGLRRTAADIARHGAWAVRVSTMGAAEDQSPRRRQAMKVIERYTALSLPSAFIPLPMVDVGVLVTVQMVMLHRLARIYEVPFSRSRARLAASTLILGIPQAISGEVASVLVGGMPMLKAIPGLGTIGVGVAMSVLWCGATWALGLVFVEHFESGGTLLDFDLRIGRAAFVERFRQRWQDWRK